MEVGSMDFLTALPAWTIGKVSTEMVKGNSTRMGITTEELIHLQIYLKSQRDRQAYITQRKHLLNCFPCLEIFYHVTNSECFTIRNFFEQGMETSKGSKEMIS